MKMIHRAEIMEARDFNHLQALLSERLSEAGSRPAAVHAVPQTGLPENHHAAALDQQRPLWVRLTGGDFAQWRTWAARGAWAVFVVSILLALMGVGR